MSKKHFGLEFTGEILTKEVLWEGIYPMSHIVCYEKKLGYLRRVIDTYFS